MDVRHAGAAPSVAAAPPAASTPSSSAPAVCFEYETGIECPRCKVFCQADEERCKNGHVLIPGLRPSARERSEDLWHEGAYADRGSSAEDDDDDDYDGAAHGAAGRRLQYAKSQKTHASGSPSGGVH